MATEIDDGLTDEEREALESKDDIIEDGTDGNGDGGNDEGGGEESSNDQNQEDSGKGNADDDGAGNDDGATGNDDAAATAAATDDGSAAGATDTEQQAGQTNETSSPLLVVDAPADAEEKLAEISTKKADLVEQFDNGDITAKEYQQQLDALNKDERKIELQVHEANLAQKLESQRQANEWKSTVDNFIRENSRYNPQTSPRMYQLLDIEVRNLAKSEEFKNRNDSAAGREILQRAHENLAKDLGFEATKPAAQTQKAAPKKDAPPSLHNTPAADANDVSGGKYAVLDRLATKDPIAYEEALMKLTDKERDAYLSA